MSNIKAQILEALAHPEAEDGLYLDNLRILHEAEERPAVEGTQIEVLEVLKELISEGLVKADEGHEKVVFSLV